MSTPTGFPSRATTTAFVPPWSVPKTSSIVADEGKPIGVLTRSDLLEFLAHQR